MLGHLFYFAGLFVFFMSLFKTISYFRFIDVKEWAEKFKKVTEKVPDKNDFRSVEDHDLLASFGCFSLIEILWVVCGILTKSWYIFLSGILIGMLLKPIANKLPFSAQKIVGFTFSIIKTLIILILVINHYHLHINWMNIF